MSAGLDADVEVAMPPFRLRARCLVGPGQVVAVVGPNGAGKSTMLRALAGLVPLAAGRVVLGADVLEDVAAGRRLPPERRQVGVVFQDGLLFPHLDALDNVAFGLRSRGVGRVEARRRAGEWLARLGVAEAAASRPSELSGGARQRVALARALVVEPALLLLDEPLSSVDVEGRGRLRRMLAEHLASFGGVPLLVTHDPLEALTLADHVVVLEHGRVTQEGSPGSVVAAPRSGWVAELVGVNLLRGRGRRGGIELHGGGWLAAPDARPGDVFAVVHPRSVALYRNHPEGTPRNVWAGRVDGIEHLGERARVRISSPDRPPLVAEVTPAAVATLGLDRGGRVWVAVKATDVRVHPA